jgi:hypothetical protein
MTSQDESLDLEINGTANYILEQNGLSRVAKLLCEKCNLHTFQDLGNLTSEKFNSIELTPVQRKKLIELVTNCGDENTYKKYRREQLNKKKNNELKKDEIVRHEQHKCEERNRVEQWRGSEDPILDSDLPVLELTPQCNKRELARASLENLLAKLVS